MKNVVNLTPIINYENLIKTYPKILFILVRDKVNKQGKCPINCRITLNKKSTGNGFSTGIYVKPDKFKSKEKRIMGDPVNTDLLCDIEQDIKAIFLDCKNKNIELTAKELQNLYKSKGELQISTEPTWQDLIDAYYKFYENKHKAKNITYSTLQGIWFHNLLVIDFVKTLPSQFLKDVKSTYFDLFNTFLIDTKKLKASYASKILQYVRSMFSFAVREKLSEHNPFLGLHLPKFSKQISENDYLIQKELESLEGYYTLNPTLQKVRDFALFVCYTGLAYVDYCSLTTKNIRKTEDGTVVIELDRQKTNSNTLLPLLPKAQKLIEKYNSVEELPKMTNQRFNLYLKVIADAVGITKNLHCHLFRTTFGVHALNYWGVPLETVSAMMGHKSVKTTQKYYVKVLEEKVLRDTRHLLVV